MRVLWTVVVVLFVGCSSSSAPSAEGEAPAEAPTESKRMVGELHDGGQRHRVMPLILHPAHMDFRVGCLLERDQARKLGDTPRPLCFDEDRRSSPPTKLRIEYRLGLQVSESMQRLAGTGEAAHFIVEATGTLYQVLDLGHAARRDGALRPDEVRVISGNSGGTNTLVEILKSHYGTLEVERVEVPTKPSPTVPKAESAPGTQP